jgi:hypothetical protein
LSAGTLLLIAAGAVGVALASLAYLRLESPGPGRLPLLVLRVAAIVLVVVLLADPIVPGTAPPVVESGPRSWVLLDWGPGLDVTPDDEGISLREQALAVALESTGRGDRLALLGLQPEGIAPADLEDAPARAPVPDPGPALRRLAEAGADSIVLVSPLRFPPSVVERALDGLPAAVSFVRIGEQVRNAGVFEVDLPRRVPAGDPIEGAVVLFGEGGGPADSLTVQVAVDGAPGPEWRVPLPAAGARVQLPIRLAPVPDTGVVRVTVRVVLDGDRFARDDERVARVRIGPPDGGIVLVSLTPDWEPRVLVPILEAATGLEGEGYLRLGVEGDRWLPLGGTGVADAVDSERVRERVSGSGLLVLHGVDDRAPPWLEGAAQAHPRVLHLPLGPLGDRLAGLPAGGTRAGEWLVAPDLPASPVAPFLTGLVLAGLPPLADLKGPPEGAVIPVLSVRRSPQEEVRPVVVLREAVAGRRAVALASGFWRWGHRSGEAREVYRGLWSGVAGWLTEIDAVPGGEIRPIRPVVARDEPQEWEASRGAGGRLLLSFRALGEGGSGDARVRSVALDERGRGAMSPLPAGRWTWEAEVEVPEGETLAGDLTGSGTFEVEGWSRALVVPPIDPAPEAHRPDRTLARTAEGRDGRPLRTHWLPYLLLIALLCGEWILRRRAGLR